MKDLRIRLPEAVMMLVIGKLNEESAVERLAAAMI